MGVFQISSLEANDSLGRRSVLPSFIFLPETWWWRLELCQFSWVVIQAWVKPCTKMMAQGDRGLALSWPYLYIPFQYFIQWSFFLLRERVCEINPYNFSYSVFCYMYLIPNNTRDQCGFPTSEMIACLYCLPVRQNSQPRSVARLWEWAFYKITVKRNEEQVT